jgi:hypothetical protein
VEAEQRACLKSRWTSFGLANTLAFDASVFGQALKRAVQIRLDDTLSIPLDVEPLRSKSPYLAVAVSPVPLRQLAASNKETWKPYAHLVALDITGKCLASADLIIPYP